MNDDVELTKEERRQLLEIARHAVEVAACGEPLPVLDLENLPPRLREPGAVFITLTRCGELRGCIGALEAYQPLAQDVVEHAAAAAVQDFRFLPVTPEELAEIEIEISRLTTPVPLQYEKPEDLPGLLQPGLDGVVLRDGFLRATFLPQVWDKIPSPQHFLDLLCRKMGLPANTWRSKKMQVFIYHVEEFHEENRAWDQNTKDVN